MREIPNILQILTFQAFLALIVHDAIIVGLTTAVLCSAYLGSRDRFPGEPTPKKMLNRFFLMDLVFSGALGFLSGQMALVIVQVVQN